METTGAEACRYGEVGRSEACRLGYNWVARAYCQL